VWSLRNLLRWAIGERCIELARSGNEILVVGTGINAVRLDRGKRQVFRWGHPLARWSELAGVRLVKIRDADHPDYWRVLLLLRSSRSVVLGEATDELEASTAAAQVATFCNVPVEIRR
jgi:hypothetical protein